MSSLALRKLNSKHKAETDKHPKFYNFKDYSDLASSPNYPVVRKSDADVSASYYIETTEGIL